MNEKVETPQTKPRFLAWAMLAFAALVIVWFTIGRINQIYDRWDDDEDRGATIALNDPFDSNVTEITSLEQGWDAADSLWFYNATQGSNLLPYDFFLFLERVEDDTLFRSNENINKYRYMPQKSTFFYPKIPSGLVLYPLD